MSKILNMHIPAENKNLAINGALDFWQEKGSTTTTVNTATSTQAYAADMISVQSQGTSVKNYSYGRSTDVPTLAQAGFQAPYSFLFTQITGIPSMNANDQTNTFLYFMEGSDYARIHGKVITIGFWIKASVAGNYPVSIRNSAGDRSLVTNVVVNQANTHEFKTVTVTLDSSGTWLFDSNRGMIVTIGACAGSASQVSTTGTWQSGNFVSTTTSTNWMATSGATIRISLFSIVEGSLGFGAIGFQRNGKSIQQEFASCQRYYEKSYSLDVTPGTSTVVGCVMDSAVNTQRLSGSVFQVSKRVVPSIFTFYSQNGTLGKVTALGGADSGTGTANTTIMGTSSFDLIFSSGGLSANSNYYYHWVADSRL